MKKLTFKEILIVASMLFGMFFGAGNLIFPVSMGQMAGNQIWAASAGFLITGVGLPLLGVAALGISRENGLLGLSSRVGKGYGLFFTSALYLTIGPFFAIPRCATVSYTVGIEQLLPGTGRAPLAIFSLLFFGAVLFFSLRPGEILTWIGKVLNPLFLCFLAVLIFRGLTAPAGEIAKIVPSGAYAGQAFSTGLLEGYNTMDALAGLAFGIVVVEAIRGLGVSEPAEVAKNTVYAGIFSSILMAVIYILVTVLGAQSRGVMETAANGILFWKRRSLCFGGDRYGCLPENGGRPDHQLRRDVFVACTGRAFLFCLGGGLLCTVFFDRESGPGYDPCLFGSCFDVPLSACDRFGAFDAFWKSLWK